MRLAAIDIGTNSVHMIVVRVRPDFSFEVVDREKEMVRLGAGGLDGKKMTPESMNAALQALSKFQRLATSHQVDEILAVATSATPIPPTKQIIARPGTYDPRISPVRIPGAAASIIAKTLSPRRCVT